MFVTDGQRVRRWREIKNYKSIRAFARVLGWSRMKVHRIEAGDQPLKETDRDRVLSVLGLSKLEFYGHSVTVDTKATGA